MARSPRADGWAERARFALLLVLFGACFLFGGASRLDVPPLVVLQPLAVLCAAAFLLTPGPVRWSEVRVPLLALAGLAGVMLAQLVPLPPAIWTALPGHGPFADTALAAGIEQPWRPISLTPDLTLASLAGLVVPLAILIGLAANSRERGYQLIPWLLAGVLLSILLGLAQMGGGERSPFYLYQTTNLGAPVGFFSNRNHQAVLLAMAIPLLAIWVRFSREQDEGSLLRHGIAAAMMIVLIPVLAVTGSRAGLAFAALGLASGIALLRMGRKLQPAAHRRILAAYGGAVVVGGLLLLTALVMQGRDEAIQRSLATIWADEDRLRFFPAMMRMLADFFPLGSGFGSFDPVFRAYEPLHLLEPPYYNHAHNDLLELAITGGLPALLVAVLFLIWLGKSAYAVLRNPALSRADRVARLGIVMVVIMLLSSLVDYPLRTPLLAALFAIAIYWIGRPEAAAAGPAESD